MALLVWGPGCYALKDRDQWIGWSAPQRVGRLKLIVQNRRFLLLSEKGRARNLASQAMGAALRELSAQWEERFGYRPLLAESFTDPETYAGTHSTALRAGSATRPAIGGRWDAARVTAGTGPIFMFPTNVPNGFGCGSCARERAGRFVPCKCLPGAAAD